jgi:hypothetical protein
MIDNKQQTAVEWYAIEMYEYFRSMFGSGIINTDILEKAKEIEKERMIKLIHFIVSEKELVDYSSVSKETANYYLDKFNQGDNK